MDNIKRKEVRVQLLPEQVTEDILQKIYYRSTGKVYDSINGTTCHQCRLVEVIAEKNFNFLKISLKINISTCMQLFFC